MTKRMYDAASAPSSPPKWEVAAGYIGGDDYHTWSDAEWASQPARWRLPIYVRSNPGSSSPHTDAAAAIAWLRAHKVPRGCAIALDLEAAVDGAYVRAFDSALLAAGYVTLAYGSLSTILRNPRTSGGYWIAHYTGSPHMEPGAVATQWADDKILGVPYDANLISDSVPLWDTYPTPPPQEEDVAAIVSLGADTQKVPAKGFLTVKFVKVYSDVHHLLSKAGDTITPPADNQQSIMDAILDLGGVQPEDSVDLSWTRLHSDLKTVLDDSWRVPKFAAKTGQFRHEFGGQDGLWKSDPLQLRIYNGNAYEVTVNSVLAKLTFLKAA